MKNQLINWMLSPLPASPQFRYQECSQRLKHGLNES